MIRMNENYGKLKESYLFFNISKKVKAYQADHPGVRMYRLGIGDVSLPLCSEVISALRQAVEDQGNPERFQGYTPECGMPFFREAVAGYYAGRGIRLDPEEVFVSSGASDELGDILDLFDASSAACIMEPAYPAYLDASIMAGRQIVTLSAGPGNGFLPTPEEKPEADLIYLCSPNNPTGAVYSREKLKQWVDYANARGAVILFDAAYEAYIRDEDVPHSIYECEGARECAIEIRSFSKNAGFTGVRLGYTVVPKDLMCGEASLRDMWARRHGTKYNGAPYIIQRAGAACYTEEGRASIMGLVEYYMENAKTI